MNLIKFIKRNFVLLGLLLLFTVLLSACGNESEENGETVHKVENDTKEENDDKKESDTLEVLNELAANTADIEEIYITDDLVIGKDEEVKPGIYDLEITGGSGNIFGERSDLMYLDINWIGGTEGNDMGDPSKIRIILFEEDTLEFSDISKVKFNAIPEEVEPSNELGVGEFIVGRDIMPGDYKLSTNVEMDPEYENLGWSISMYNDENGKQRDQMYTATNDDVLVSLKEGEIISLFYDNIDYESSADDAKLIFTEE